MKEVQTAVENAVRASGVSKEAQENLIRRTVIAFLEARRIETALGKRKLPADQQNRVVNEVMAFVSNRQSSVDALPVLPA